MRIKEKETIEKKVVTVYSKDKGDKPWRGIVLQEGPCQSIIRWVEADEILVGKTACVMNTSLMMCKE